MDHISDGATISATALDEAAAPAGQGQITATLVPEHEWLGFLPRHFGPLYLLVENTVFDTMGRLCPHYSGGFWDFYTLSNGGAFLAPADAPAYLLQCDGNGFDGWVAAKAAGTGVTAIALNQLSFGRDGAHFAELYYRLRDYINQQAEAGQL